MKGRSDAACPTRSTASWGSVGGRRGSGTRRGTFSQYHQDLTPDPLGRATVWALCSWWTPSFVSWHVCVSWPSCTSSSPSSGSSWLERSKLWHEEHSGEWDHMESLLLGSSTHLLKQRSLNLLNQDATLREDSLTDLRVSVLTRSHPQRGQSDLRISNNKTICSWIIAYRC